MKNISYGIKNGWEYSRIDTAEDVVIVGVMKKPKVELIESTAQEILDSCELNQNRRLNKNDNRL